MVADIKRSDIPEYKDTLMYKGLKLLNDYLVKNELPDIHLDVVGGFAMIFHELRDSCVTDIDYIGEDLSDEIKKVSDKIGLKLKLGTGWINNDVMLAGSTREDLEVTTGKLHFVKAFAFEKISVSVLDKKDLLRMKVIAIDTSLSGGEFGGEFTRIKDLPDIAVLMKERNMDLLSLELETYQYSISDKTYEVIEDYIKHNDLEKTTDFLEKYSDKHADAYELLRLALLGDERYKD